MKRKIIDILVSVIDNYGDMGFAFECVDVWRSRYGDTIDFVIWTNAPQEMKVFAEKVGYVDIPVYSREHFGKERPCEILLALLHTPLPDEIYFADRSLVLNIDYLSFDPQWVQHNNVHHIRSSESHEIIELIPSPLPQSAGLLPIFPTKIERSALAKRYRINPTMTEWISIFAYDDTLQQIDWKSFPPESQVFVFGEIGEHPENIQTFSLLSNIDFHAFLEFSDWAIIRGDVTGAWMYQQQKPYYWDIYREIGGIHETLSQDFLHTIGATEHYRNIHEKINRKNQKHLTYYDLIGGLGGMDFSFPLPENLITNIKKYIDRFYFSL